MLFTDEMAVLTYYHIINGCITLPLPAMLIRIITWMFVIGIVYRLLNRYILPIFRFTATANNHLRKMQDQMKEMDNKINDNNRQRPSVEKEGDYIDYEEIK